MRVALALERAAHRSGGDAADQPVPGPPIRSGPISPRARPWRNRSCPHGAPRARHDLAHVLDARGSYRRDRLLDGLGDLALVELLRQEGGDHDDLGAALARPIRAARPSRTCAADSWRCLIIFCSSATISSSLACSLPAPRAFDVAVLDGGNDQPDRGEARLVARISRRPSSPIEFVPQRHHRLLSPSRSAE